MASRLLSSKKKTILVVPLNSASPPRVIRSTATQGEGSEGKVRKAMYEAKQEDFATTTEPATDGAIRSVDSGDLVNDPPSGKDTMHEAWKAAKDTADWIQDNDEEEEKGPNTYDNFEGEDGVEDLRKKAGGYDKKDHK